jgi:AraC-like DNA-binding protein
LQNFSKNFLKIGNFSQNWHTYCMSALKDRLQPYVAQIVRRELTNRAVAAILGASETHVCRTLRKMGVVRDAKPSRESKKALLGERQTLRTDLARKTLDGSLTVAEAARQAHCSERTIQRYRSRL